LIVVGVPLNVAVPVKVSLSVKAISVFEVPESTYLTYKVSGSVPSVSTVFTTLPFKPEVPPVISIPLKKIKKHHYQYLIILQHNSLHQKQSRLE